MNKTYIIERASCLADLQDRVTCRMGSGWKPIGGIAIDNEKLIAKYLQAMIKENEDE